MGVRRLSFRLQTQKVFLHTPDGRWVPRNRAVHLQSEDKKLGRISAAPLFSLSTSFCAQSCVHESDLRSTNTLSLVSTIPRIKRIGVRLFHSNDTAFVYITFLGSVATPVVWAIKSLILCLHDCASYPSLGRLRWALRLFPLDFSSALYLRLLHSGIFLSQKGVELSSGVSRRLVKMRRSQSLDVCFNTSLHPGQSHH